MATKIGSATELLAFLAGVDAEVGRRLLEQAAREAPDETDGERLERAARAAGLRLHESACDAETLEELTAAAGRIVVVAEDGTWTGAEARAGAFRLVRPGREPSSVTNLGALGSTATGPLRAWTAQPLSPLTSHDGHGDGHAHPSPARRLLQLLRTESSDLWVVTIYAAVIGLLSLAVPVAVQALVNNVVFGQLLQPIVVLTLLLFVVLAFAGLLRALQAQVVEWIQQRLFVRVAAELAHKLPRVRADQLDHEHAPELVNRFFDVLTVQKSAATLLLDGLALALQTVIGLVLVAFYHPLLLALSLLLTGATAFIVLALGRRGPATAIEESKAKYAVAAWLEEMARHPAAFKSGGASAFALDRTDELARGYLLARRSHFRVVFMQKVGSYVLHAIASAFLLGLGGWLVMSGQMSLGALVAAELVLGTVLLGLTKLGKQLEALYDLLAAVDKVGHLVDLPVERDGGHALPGAAAVSLRLRGLELAHEDGRRIVAGSDAFVAAGSKVALLGREGSGKSTLLHHVYGLHAPVAGAVELDGVDLRELSLEDLRRAVALVDGIEVFDGTVEENVRVGRPHVSRPDVRNALRLVGLHDEVAALPRGLDTPLPTGGRLLSDGQLARLMIARALAGRPRLLLLDEALDGVDDRNRELLMGALFAPGAPWTLVCATHNRAVAEACDARLVIEDGRIATRRPGEAA
jgi:ABC-type bacteriocin/lantibiotic exporter with double-glycine peptidase domain